MKITTRLLHVVLAAVLLGLPTIANAQMNYQGRLTAADGLARGAGPTKLTFSIWDASGTKIWGDYVMDGLPGDGHGPKADVIADGRFNVIIGATDTASRSMTTQIAAAGTTTGLFLEIKVEDETAISPRQQILATPRALFADLADLAATIPNVTPTLAGNIGIGTTPDSKLHVNGSAAAPALKVDVNGSSKLVVNPNGGVSVGANATPPSNGLSVSGNITANGKGVVVGEENLRIVRGVVELSGNHVGTGFTVPVHSTTSTINFSPPFSGIPTITATVADVGQAFHTTVASVTTNGFNIATWNNSNNGQKVSFHFIAIGPR